MAYEMVMPYHLHMPSYFLETFTEYPYLIYSYKALDIVKLVWAIVLSVPKAMREPENEIRQYVPTPLLFIACRREQVSVD